MVYEPSERAGNVLLARKPPGGLDALRRKLLGISIEFYSHRLQNALPESSHLVSYGVKPRRRSGRAQTQLDTTRRKFPERVDATISKWIVDHRHGIWVHNRIGFVRAPSGNAGKMEERCQLAAIVKSAPSELRETQNGASTECFDGVQ